MAEHEQIQASSEQSVSDLANLADYFPYGQPVAETQAAREAAVKVLWEKRSMLPEHGEEIVEDVLRVALPFFRFYPLGDNHHRADVCPYCRRS